ncbi:MAG: hypothetical protein JXA60_05575 [Candidatus Coatesbacteria bacterium]|nr:hypothetical protein [Candidatus Coatesbacteria bacterium]
MEELMFKHVLKNPVTGEEEQILIINPQSFAIPVYRLQMNAFDLIFLLERNPRLACFFIEYYKKVMNLKSADVRTLEENFVEAAFIFESFLEEHKEIVKASRKYKQFREFFYNIFDCINDLILNLETAQMFKDNFSLWVKMQGKNLDDIESDLDWAKLFLEFYNLCEIKYFLPMFYI